jgi:hypothetical protein
LYLDPYVCITDCIDTKCKSLVRAATCRRQKDTTDAVYSSKDVSNGEEDVLLVDVPREDTTSEDKDGNLAKAESNKVGNS